MGLTYTSSLTMSFRMRYVLTGLWKKRDGPIPLLRNRDISFDDGTSTDEFTILAELPRPERVQHVLGALEIGQAGVPPRGLIFCSRKDARQLSDAFNQASLSGRRLRTIALTGDDAVRVREEAVERLEQGELDYILTVDVFNEGVDIPTVNQVVMLRQTQSAIVFVQQLGRGLRKAPGKEYLVVVDFIGNYANNYLIPIALFGDESLNKESLRQNLIAAEEIGVVAGLSSVRFDKVAEARVLASVSQTRLDDMLKLRLALKAMRDRVGGSPPVGLLAIQVDRSDRFGNEARALPGIGSSGAQGGGGPVPAARQSPRALVARGAHSQAIG